MKYTGKDQSVVKDQEMPAVFVDAELANLAYVDGRELKRRVPKWSNESGTASENWVADVDDNHWGIGIYTPGTGLNPSIDLEVPIPPRSTGFVLSTEDAEASRFDLITDNPVPGTLRDAKLPGRYVKFQSESYRMGEKHSK